MLYTGCSGLYTIQFPMCMSTLEEICGDYSGEDTPVPIPNTEVKILSADDTWRATSRESKTLPLISLFGPMVKRLRHRPFTAVTRVRFPVGSPKRKTCPSGHVFFNICFTGRGLCNTIGMYFRNTFDPKGAHIIWK